MLVHQGLTRLEDLLQAEVSDLAGIPEIGEQAAAIMEAARAEAGRRRKVEVARSARRIRRLIVCGVRQTIGRTLVLSR